MGAEGRVNLQPVDFDQCPTGVISVLLNLTHNCNLACRYCIMSMPALRQGYQQRPVSMDPTLVRQSIDYIRQVGLKGTNITFYGGEPLLCFDLLKYAVEYAEENYPDWFAYNIITNATLLEPRMADFFAEQGVRFLFSLDGDQAMNDRLRVFKTGDVSVHATAWRNIDALLARYPGIEYKVNVTYFRSTLDLAAAFRYLLERGVPASRFERGLIPADSPWYVGVDCLDRVKAEFSEIAELYLQHLLGGGSHRLDNLLNLMRKIAKGTPRLRGCNMGIDYLTIAADGTVYPCHKLVGHEGFDMGHVAGGTDNERYREIWRNNVLQRQGCAGCEERLVCGGYCVCDNHFHNGDFFQPTLENCEIVRHNIALARRLLAELERLDPMILKRLLGGDYWLDSDKPARSPEAVAEGGQIRQSRTGGVYELNPVAAWIFDLCDGSKTVAGIAAAIAEKTNQEQATVLTDVKQQLVLFRETGLVDR